jgi:RNA polymerase sigma-70 factor (ECF subfamily)
VTNPGSRRTDATGPTATYPSPGPEVIQRAAAGDVGAFAEIYECCAPGVRRYVGTIVWDRWDADDVTQEVFVKLFTGLPQYDADRAAFSAWMLRVARNAAIDHLRRHRGHPTLLEFDERTPVDEAGRACGESLRAALAELPASQREILVLRALGGFTPPEVASRVKRSRGCINTLFHRARRSAKERLTAMECGPSTCAGAHGTDVEDAALSLAV